MATMTGATRARDQRRRQTDAPTRRNAVTSRSRSTRSASSSAKARPAATEDGGIVVQVDGAIEAVVLCFPTADAMGRRAAALFQATLDETPSGAAERRVVDLMLEFADGRDGRESLRGLSLGGAPLPGMIHSALLVDEGTLPVSQVADLCGLCSFVLRLDQARYGIGAAEVESWRALGSAAAVSLAGLRPMTLSVA